MTEDDKAFNVGRAVIDYCNAHTELSHNKELFRKHMEAISSASRSQSGIMSGEVPPDWVSSQDVKGIVGEIARIKGEVQALKVKLNDLGVGSVIIRDPQ